MSRGEANGEGYSELIESRTFGTGFLGGDEGGGEGRWAYRSFDSASFPIQNRWSPRSFPRGRIRGKDHGGIIFRIRTPPRGGGIRFGRLDSLGLLWLSGATSSTRTKFPSATGQAAFGNGVIGVGIVGSLGAPSVLVTVGRLLQLTSKTRTSRALTSSEIGRM